MYHEYKSLDFFPISGEGQDRMIVSGLGHYMQAWQLVNTSVVVVCNLKPAKFRGVMSHGMILCASE